VWIKPVERSLPSLEGNDRIHEAEIHIPAQQNVTLIIYAASITRQMCLKVPSPANLPRAVSPYRDDYLGILA
jgi:hypothetical protein